MSRVATVHMYFPLSGVLSPNRHRGHHLPEVFSSLLSFHSGRYMVSDPMGGYLFQCFSVWLYEISIHISMFPLAEE